MNKHVPRDHSKSKKKATHKVNPAGTKVARAARNRTITLRK